MTEIRFTCPEHGDTAMWSPEDQEATCIDREEVLDLEDPSVKAAIRAAIAEEATR